MQKYWHVVCTRIVKSVRKRFKSVTRTLCRKSFSLWTNIFESIWLKFSKSDRFFSSKDPKRIGAENNLIGAKKYLGAETGHLQRWGLEFKLKRKKYNFFKWRLHASIKIRFLEEKSQWYYLRHNFSPHHHYTVLITDYWVLIIVKIIKMIVKILTLSWSSLIRPLSVSEVVRSSSVLNSWFCDHDDHGDDHVDHDEWVRSSSCLVKNIAKLFLLFSHLEVSLSWTVALVV